jgi:type VII secretion protein EccE
VAPAGRPISQPQPDSAPRRPAGFQAPASRPVAVAQRANIASPLTIGQRLSRRWRSYGLARRQPQRSGLGYHNPAATPRYSQVAFRVAAVVRIIGLGRVLCWQLAAMAVLASIGQPRSVRTAVAVLAVGVVAATTIRIRGHWAYEWLVRGGRFLLRQRQRIMEPGENTAETLVDLVTEHTTVETVELDEIPVAFIHQPGGITAVLEPHISNGPHDDGFTLSELNLSSPAPLLPPPDVDSPPFAAQVIMQMAQAPTSGGGPGVTRRRTWITLQAIRTADIYRDDDLSAALANASRRLIRRLARDELPTRTLDRDEAMSLIVGLSQLGDVAAGADPVPFRETWSAWDAGPTTQACFRIDKWQEAGEAARRLILHRLQLVPSLGTTVAVAARRRDRPGDAQANVIVRITETSRARLNNSADLLAFAMENTGSGVGWERLNGDQLAAVVASLPFGGQATAS